MAVQYFRSQSIRGFQFPKEKLHGVNSINWAAVYAVCYNEDLHKDIYVVLPDVIRRPLDVGTLIDYVLFDTNDSRGWYLRESMPDNSRVYDEPEDIPNINLHPINADVAAPHVHQMMTDEKINEITGQIPIKSEAHPEGIEQSKIAEMKTKMSKITTGPVFGDQTIPEIEPEPEPEPQNYIDLILGLYYSESSWSTVTFNYPPYYNWWYGGFITEADKNAFEAFGGATHFVESVAGPYGEPVYDDTNFTYEILGIYADIDGQVSQGFDLTHFSVIERANSAEYTHFGILCDTSYSAPTPRAWKCRITKNS